MVGKDFFFTQFMRSQGLLFEEAILYILSSKNFLFAMWTFDLNSFQCWMLPEVQYLFKLSVQAWVHHSLEYLVMRFLFAWEYQVSLKMLARCWTTVSRASLDMISIVSRARMLLVIALIKFSSSSLSLQMDQMTLSMLASSIPTSIIRGTWSEGLRKSGCRVCWPNPELLGLIKTRSITELESCRLSANLVSPGLIGGKSSRPRLSAKVTRSSIWMEWWG